MYEGWPQASYDASNTDELGMNMMANQLPGGPNSIYKALLARAKRDKVGTEKKMDIWRPDTAVQRTQQQQEQYLRPPTIAPSQPEQSKIGKELWPSLRRQRPDKPNNRNLPPR